MKAAGGPQKLRFTIQSCSGEVRQRTLLLVVAGSAAATAAVARALTSCLIYHRTPITLSGSSCTTAHRREDGSLPGAGCGRAQPTCYQQPSACVPTPSLCAAAAVPDRFCKYPQELVLRLERPSKVQQIQILAHEYKVGAGPQQLHAVRSGPQAH